MKKQVKKIIKELKLNEKMILSIDESETDIIYFQKIIEIHFRNHDDLAVILLNAYDKKEFQKNDYSKEIKEQLEEQKYLFFEEEEEKK